MFNIKRKYVSYLVEEDNIELYAYGYLAVSLPYETPTKEFISAAMKSVGYNII